MKKADGSMTEEDLIGDWLAAKERHAKAADELNGASCDLTNTTNEVARRLVPKDAKVGEKLAVRYFDAFYVVEKTDDWRARGSSAHFGRLQFGVRRATAPG